VALPSRDCQVHSLGLSQQEGPRGTPGQVLSCGSLREAKISEDLRPTSIAQLAVPAGQVCLYGVCHSPNIRCPPRVSSPHVHLSQLTSLCQSAQVHRSGKKLQHTTRSFLEHFSLWSPDKWSSTTHVRWTNTWCCKQRIFITCPFTCLI